MADNKRRGEDADDDRLNDDVVSDSAEDDATDAEEPAAGGGTATRERSRTRIDGDKVGPFGRIARFVREVVAELRKVIWPTRKELLTYTGVVIAFVTVMLTIVAVLDYAFAKGVLWVFGNPS
ncbi:preprotein translocase subunit SecE [Micromonospora phaseoli]|uniref:Protein translocase subunit SecE n=1 Tax=Micromonospora phaseoli TaxID=1144548 RepID=A0A1H6X6H9_9ACTN|nr:preprotein translocase subunit SecE [Micromonospora phaseoli]PZW02119.1 preprotein translocase subunit SecE [Micromonospora phaseoli]GIJ75878.1 hypothetical protein Xph01_03100 [Micromonospora phaseoli]SEJ24759.1 preprotein translocase subunit SecE [Micromonospora phaseoli]